ncbi:hypothetical protein HaLaN_21112 [Haematococcus lacustris]|uniref:Uncharacterized protein n=1 Tax=Haematococcus lacustris TaxID=44745 RepID=A0A699ZNH4_HAELA|nr:hypothetical protein HaLaN_21112 [Haematococcus lacustris]
MSLVAQCLRGSGPVPRSKSRIRLKARENKVLAPLQANNARSEGLNGRPNDDRYAPAPALYAPALFVSRIVSWPVNVACQSADCAWSQVIKVPGGAVMRGCKKPDAS